MVSIPQEDLLPDIGMHGNLDNIATINALSRIVQIRTFRKLAKSKLDDPSSVENHNRIYGAKSRVIGS